MNEAAALAAGLLAAPLDNARWLILADWLDEHPEVEPGLVDVMRLFVADRVFKGCKEFMYSCSELFTDGRKRRDDLESLVKVGCAHCQHWANSQIVEGILLDRLHRLFVLPSQTKESHG